MGLFGKQEPETATVDGKPFNCLVCHHDKFQQREAQLHTMLATLFGLDWANQNATCLVCDNCGYIHWFLAN